MDYSTYRRMTNEDLVGRDVITRRRLGNGLVTIPVGSVMTIERKMKGFSLVGKPCPNCLIQARVRKVEWTDVDLLPTEEVGNGGT